MPKLSIGRRIGGCPGPSHGRSALVALRTHGKVPRQAPMQAQGQEALSDSWEGARKCSY